MPIRSALVVTVVGAGILGWSVPADSESRASCRGAKAQANYLALAGGKISLRRVGCGTGRTVVKRFAQRCVGAYTSQGTCRVKARKRWRCTSKLVGGPNSGALSAIKCSSGKARIGFRVRLSTEAIEIPPSGLAYPGLPYSANLQCIDTNAAGDAAAPPAAPNDGVVIRTTGAMPVVIAEAVQEELVSHNVIKRLVDGLGVHPRNFPTLLPVFLRRGVPHQGITDFSCASQSLDAAVVEIGDTVQSAAQVSAHELFHAHSRGIILAPGYPWFDDAAAEWSVWKAGLRNGPSAWEAELQQPNNAVDTLQPPGWKYAIWRFVQFLDDQGMVTSGGSWPLIRAVVATAPNLTVGLNQQLVARQTSLGQELNAFWAEHLKTKPQRPPRVVPTAANSEQVRIAAGQTTREVVAGNLHTKLVDFDVGEGVNRVEFEFEPVVNGYFSGLVAPNETRRFDPAGSVSFCIGEASGENLAWPGHFPVVFTNGALGGGDLEARIRVFAQTNAEQCGEPTNRACSLLREAGVRGLLGPDLPNIPPFAGSKGKTHGRRYTECGYKGRGGGALVQVQRWSSAKAARKWIQRKAKSPGWRSIKAGDTAIIFESPAGVFVQVAVGQELLTVEVSSDRGSTSIALRLAHEVIPKL